MQGLRPGTPVNAQKAPSDPGPFPLANGWRHTNETHQKYRIRGPVAHNVNEKYPSQR